MTPREHHYLFSQHLLPKHVFDSPDKVFEELNAPMREAFLMFLWESVGEVVDIPLKPVDVGTIGGIGQPAVHKLDVLGSDRRGGWTLIMISMPPTEAVGEALYVALAKRGHEVRYFLYEHSLEPGRPTFAEKRPDGTRLNMGHGDGIAPNDFLIAIGRELEFSTADAKVGHRPAQTGPKKKKKKSSAVLKGCLGCGVLVAGFGLMMLIGIGTIAYYEEIRPMHDHTAEIASTEISASSPFVLQHDTDGTGYSSFDYWLVVPDEGPVSADAQFTCATSFGEIPETRSISDADWETVREDGMLYLRIHDDYMRHRPGIATCGGMIDPMLGELEGARVIVTRTQRPSDFMAF